MNIKQWILVLFAVLAVGGCASSGAPGTAAAPAEGENVDPAQSEDDPNRVVCRREHVVGSNFTRRVCRTVRQIEEERTASQQQLEQERTRMLQKALPPPNN